ncbi:MAG TPA: hypothetical protein DC049_00825, partial [Spirochaetia bacterium]|nr:hypothetical protein [Spirochaetia bacterium]
MHSLGSGSDYAWGYNSDTYPFSVFLEPGEEVTTHSVFLFAYQGGDQEQSVHQGLKNFIRELLPKVKILNPFYYCTWMWDASENLNIDENLLLEQVDRAQQLGFGIFVIDDGWFKPGSGCRPDKEKFPQGLEKIAQTVKDKGMRFGLWYNVGTEYGNE